MEILQPFWPVIGPLASAAGVQALRWIFRQPAAWKHARAWMLAALVVVLVLLAWRYSWRASPIGNREQLERYTGLQLPFWPSESRHHDDGAGTIVASLSLSVSEVARVPRGTPVSRHDAEALLRDASGRGFELATIASDARLDSTTRCIDGWYSVVLVDRHHRKAWIALFYPNSEGGALPCIAE